VRGAAANVRSCSSVELNIKFPQCWRHGTSSAGGGGGGGGGGRGRGRGGGGGGGGVVKRKASLSACCLGGMAIADEKSAGVCQSY